MTKSEAVKSVSPGKTGGKRNAAGSKSLSGMQIEAALKASEQNFRNSLDNSILGIRISDKKSRTLYANRPFMDIFGYTALKEVNAKPPQEYYSPRSHDEWVLRNEKFLHGEPMPAQIDVEIVRKDGTTRSLEISMRSILWDGKPQYQTTYNDITERKQAEQACKSSEEKYAILIEESTDGILILNGHTIEFANHRIFELTGYSRAEIIGKQFIELVAPEDKKQLDTSALRRLAPREANILDLKMQARNGKHIPVETRAHPIVFENHPATMVIVSDVTERKQAEEAKRLSEQNFRNSLDSSFIGIRISDRSDRTSYVNQALMDIFGYTNMADVEANPPPEFYTPATHAAWVIRHEKLLRGEPMPKQVDIDIQRRDGTIRNLDVSMREIYWDGKQQFQTLYNDITERKRAEAALHESEEKYRLIVENSSDIIFTLNASGDFIYISPSIKNVLGYSVGDVINQPFSSIVHPDDITAVQNVIRTNVFDGHQTPSGIEYRVRQAAGGWRWHNGTGNSVRDDKGKFLYFLGITRDITEIKHLEEETKQANERLTTLVKKLEEQQRQSAILTEMRDMLQACSKMEETGPIIMGFMKKLFPASQGALFLLSNSRSDLESVVTWGDFPTASDNNVFPPDACWGLRRGRAHVVDDINVGPICPHLVHTPVLPYVCLPLMAKGDILGLLHLKNAFNTNGAGHSHMADLRQMATTLSEYLSLSIANVKLSESLSRQSIQDVQTGLYNRRFMEESLLRELTRAARKQTPIGIIMGDLDHFKKFNDVYGHAAGDKIIAAIGKLFREKFRGSDIACRYGGEEFLIILPESTPEETFKRADAVREDIKKLEMVFQGQILGTITMSMGIATYPDNATRMEELLRVADTALYKAKQDGRDRVVAG